MRARLLVVCMLAGLGGGLASAQPYEPYNDPGRRMLEEHEARTRKMREDFARESKRMDDEFNHTAAWMVGLFVAAVVIGAISAGFAAQKRRRLSPAYPIEYEPIVAAPANTGSVDVTAIRIALDGRASKFVQSELAAIVKTYDTATAESRARRLRETSIMLRRVRDSWIYGGVDNEPMRSREQALATFASRVDDARSRIKQEPSQIVPPGRPPVSLILVSIIVAARGELMTINDRATGEDLRRALEAAVHRAADEILAVELVWVPTEAGRQLSSIDLESHYRTSELHPLEGATVGKVFCTYCSAPFPAEFVSCPHCGGPAPGRERSAS